MAAAKVTAGLMCASGLPKATAVKMPHNTANAQPVVMTIQPAPSAFERFSSTLATTPSPNRISTSVPANSPTNGEFMSPRVSKAFGTDSRETARLRPRPFKTLFLQAHALLFRPVECPCDRLLPQAIHLFALIGSHRQIPHLDN